MDPRLHASWVCAIVIPTAPTAYRLVLQPHWPGWNPLVVPQWMATGMAATLTILPRQLGRDVLIRFGLSVVLFAGFGDADSSCRLLPAGVYTEADVGLDQGDHPVRVPIVDAPDG